MVKLTKGESGFGMSLTVSFSILVYCGHTHYTYFIYGQSNLNIL